MSDAQMSMEVAQPADAKPEASRGVVRAAKKKQALRPKTELELLVDINTKFDRLIAVAAAQEKGRDDQIRILAAAGCDSSFIAAFVGVDASTVRHHDGWRKFRADAGDGAQ